MIHLILNTTLGHAVKGVIREPLTYFNGAVIATTTLTNIEISAKIGLYMASILASVIVSIKYLYEIKAIKKGKKSDTRKTNQL